MRRFIHRLQQQIDFLFFNERFKILRKYRYIDYVFREKIKNDISHIDLIVFLNRILEESLCIDIWFFFFKVVIRN